MARRRMIDPKFWGDETIGKLTPEERFFYIGLFSLADDEGRICGSPAYLRSQIYPYDDIPLDSIVTWTLHLKEIGLIHVYDDPSDNGSTYIDHPKWLKYQRLDNPAPSLLPPCPLFRSHWRKPRTIIRKTKNHSKNDSKNDSRVKEGKGREGKGKEVKEEVKGKEENIPAPSAVELSTFSQQDKRTVEKFTSEKTTFGTGRTDDNFRAEVKEACLCLARRCSDWGSPVEDEDKFVDKFFGLVSNLMRFGLAKKPDPKKVRDFKGNPTSKAKMIKLIGRMSRPQNMVAELIDAVKRQPKYLP